MTYSSVWINCRAQGCYSTYGAARVPTNNNTTYRASELTVLYSEIAAGYLYTVYLILINILDSSKNIPGNTVTFL